MATLSEMASSITNQIMKTGELAATLTLRLADVESKPTAPGAPLSQNEREEISRSIQDKGHDLPSRVFFNVVDAVLAKRNTAQHAPIASVAQADWDDQHGRRNKENSEPVSGMVSLDAVEKALRDVLSSARSLTAHEVNTAVMMLRARLSPPKTLQERIEERFRSARDNDYAYTPDALAAIAMEELEKEQK